MIKVQSAKFDVGQELSNLKASRTDIGAFALFVGTVRDAQSLTLEHYPGMTEAQLEEIAIEANTRWPLQDLLIIHRFGKMLAGEDIVLVITASAHRKAAFEACEFLMDWLKTKAPFWKLEDMAGKQDWVEAKASDDSAAARWIKN
jgi:molybdopterin synthase catalytic subunit